MAGTSHHLTAAPVRRRGADALAGRRTQGLGQTRAGSQCVVLSTWDCPHRTFRNVRTLLDRRPDPAGWWISTPTRIGRLSPRRQTTRTSIKVDQPQPGHGRYRLGLVRLVV